MDKDLYFKLVKPTESLAAFVESFWVLHNRSGEEKEIIILPDGRIDLTFSQSPTEQFSIVRSGLETFPDKAILGPHVLMFAVSFKLPATEYIFHNTVSDLLNYAEHLPADFWDFAPTDLTDFELFCKKASQKIQSLLPTAIDNRTLQLFDLIYTSKGSLAIKALSEKVHWSSRQINRYFNQQYGISLKLYCSILRFRASMEHIAKGKLFPELNFADQSHFIREIKKFSGVAPKELLKNKNDRFIQFSALSQK